MTPETRTGNSFTIAELCQAIADGRISYTLREDVYEISALDIRRFRRGGRRSPRTLAVDPYLTTSNAECQL